MPVWAPVLGHLFLTAPDTHLAGIKGVFASSMSLNNLMGKESVANNIFKSKISSSHLPISPQAFVRSKNRSPEKLLWVFLAHANPSSPQVPIGQVPWHSNLPPGMSDIVLMQPRFLGKVLPTFSAGKGTRGDTGLMCLAMPPQRGCLPKDLATVRAGEDGLGAGRCPRCGSGAWSMATLVGDQGLGRGKGTRTGEADEESSLQLLGHKVRWVLPLHVTLLELGIGEGDEAAGALQGPQMARVATRAAGTPFLDCVQLLHRFFWIWVLHDDWDPLWSREELPGGAAGRQPEIRALEAT